MNRYNSIRIKCNSYLLNLIIIKYESDIILYRSDSYRFQQIHKYLNHIRIVQSFSIDSNLCQYIPFDANVNRCQSINRSRHFWTFSLVHRGSKVLTTCSGMEWGAGKEGRTNESFQPDGNTYHLCNSGYPQEFS